MATVNSATQRLEKAKQIKQYRDSSFQYKSYIQELKKHQELQNQLEKSAQEEQAERENTSFWERFGDTFIDTFTTLGGGLLKGVEGIIDAGVGVAGSIVSVFGADTQWAEDIIKFDATDEWYYKGFENEATKNSWWNDVPIVKDVLGGVGQMLPTIALSTIGLGGVGVAGIVTSAGGTGMEEALNEDAEFGQALAYGVSQAGIEGLIEGVTAGLGKGVTTIGKSIGKTTGKSVAKSVGKVMLEESVSEGIEEGLTALVNPLSKTIYKGADVLEAYKDMNFYLDAGQQALVGGIVGGITGGSSAKIRQIALGGKTNYNISQSAQEIATLDTKENNLWKNGKLDAKALQKIQNQRQIELENISSQLMAMSEADRVNALEKLKSRKIDISSLFNEDGSINYENTQNWAVSEGDTQVLENIQNTKRKPLATDNIEAYSPRLRNKVLEFAPTSNLISENIKTAKNTIMAINPNANVVIAEDLPVGNAFYDPSSKVLYLSNKADSVEVGGHEVTHSLEGTEEYKALKDYVLSQVENLEAKIAEKIELYKNVNVEQKQGEAGEAIAIYEAETEIVAEEMGKLLSDQASIDRIVKQNKSVAARIIQWIKDAIAKLTKRGIKGEYYNQLRTAEKLYAKAIKTSFGGVSLADGTFSDNYYNLNEQERLDLFIQTFAKTEEKSYNEQNGDVRYSIKSSYSQYRTTAMIWANETRTKAGDLKVLYNPKTDTFNLLEADGSGDFVVLKQNKNYRIVKNLYEELINEQGSNFEFNESVKEFEESVRRSDNLDLWGTENNETSDTIGRRTKSESENSRIRNTKTNTGNSRYSLKDNQGSTLSLQQAEYFKDSNEKGGVNNGEFSEERYSINKRSDLGNISGQERTNKISTIRKFFKDVENAWLDNEAERLEYINEISPELNQAIKDYLKRYNDEQQISEQRNLYRSEGEEWISDSSYRGRIQEISSEFGINENVEAVKILKEVYNNSKLYDAENINKFNLSVDEFGETINIINHKNLTFDLQEICDRNKKMGINTFFYLKNDKTNSEALGFFTLKDKNIFILFDELNANFVETNRHEVMHFIQKHNPQISNIFMQEVDKVLTDEEKTKFYNTYYDSYIKSYNNFSVNNIEQILWNEIYADIYSLSLKVKNQKEIYNIVEKIDIMLADNYEQETKRYSLKDNQGNNLSPEQAEYFKDSKVRDENGDLLAVYHGTEGEFYTFDKALRGANTGTKDAKLGFFFTNKELIAKDYAIYAQDGKLFNLMNLIAQGDSEVLNLLRTVDGHKQLDQTELVKEYARILEKAENYVNDVLEVYLNIENPKIVDWKGKTYKKNAMLKLLTEAIMEKRDGVIIKNIEDSVNQDLGISDVYVAFEPNQIKLTTNKQPTLNPDMRYSIQAGYTPEVQATTANVKESYGIENINNVNEVVKKVSSKLEDTFLTTPDKQKFVKNIDTGIELTITKAGIRETFGNRKYYLLYDEELKLAKLATMEHLAKLIKYGEVRSQSASNYHNPNSTTRFTYLQAPITIDGIEYNVTIDIKETEKGNRFYIHNLLINKKEAKYPVSTEREPISERHSYSGRFASQEPDSTPYGDPKVSTFIGSNQVPTNNTIPQNTDAVNNYYDNNQKKDTRYLIKDNQGNTLSPEQAEFFRDSKVRDENGNLQVVYHGTNRQFTVFDKSKIQEGNNAFWFSKSQEYATEMALLKKGNRVNEYYLNINNPLIVEMDIKEFSDNIKEEKYITKAIKSGNDGVIFIENVDDGDVFYAVFNSNQIKLTTNKQPTLNPDMRYSLKRTTSGEPVVEIENNILEGLDRSQWVTKVKETMSKFSNGIPISGKIIKVNAITKSEFTNSKNTKYYSRRDNVVYEDKLNTSQQLDEIIWASTNYINESLNHERNDSIKEFARGEVKVAIENRKYIATTIIGTTKANNLVLYDVVDFRPAEFDLKQKKDDTAKRFSKESEPISSIKMSTEENNMLSASLTSTNNTIPQNTDAVNNYYDNNQKKDTRYLIKSKELTKGQVKKEQAKGYKTKVYDKQESDRIVTNLLEMIQNDSYYAEIKGKTKAELVDYLWIQLNAKDKGYRADVALKVADYLIDNAIMQDYYQDYANQDNIHTLDVLRDYLHKVDLSAIKGEIKHRFDKDNSPYLMWGARKGTNGLSSDVIAQELAEEGISISATNEADIFFEMHDLYKHALSEMKNNSKVTSVKKVLGENNVAKLRQDIAREVLMSYDKYGKKTKFAEYIEKSQKRLKTLRTKFADYRAFEQAQKGLKATLNSLKNKLEDKASWKVSKDVKVLVGELVKIESYYGNITKTARDNLRQVGKQLETMYGDTENKDLIPFYDVIRELTDPSKETTKFTTEEIIDITNVLKSFKHTLENYNLVSFNGEKVEIDKIAEQGIKELIQAKDLIKGLDKNPLHRLRNHVYANPVDRMAEMGLYRENSVFMQIYKDMLNGDSKRAKFVMEANMLFDDFYQRNKNYNNVLQEQMVINNGYEDITLHKRQALSLYLTSLRPQGRSHIFGIDGYEGIVKLLDNKLSTRGEMKKALDKGVEIKVTEEMLSNIEKQFTQADREYIELVKTFFNENSRKAKQEVDIALYGVSNVEDGDYFPLKVSKDKIYQEIVDNNIFQVILNFGFNKTVKPNSSNMIVIDGVDNILAEHIRNMSLYAGYALPLNAYNKIMNRQIMSENGTTNNMYGSVGKIDSNFQAYMKKLWLDIQGITTAEKGWFSKLMSRIRWATANSALGLNPKVLLTQTLSLASAQTEFNPKYIVKGMKHFFGEKEKIEMAKYAPLMWERNLVGSSVDVQDIRQIGKEIGGKSHKVIAKATEGLNKLTTTPISWMDSNVIQSLWFAAQYEVVETKGLAFGTEANKVEAGKRLTEVVFKTQQTSDALGRSEWMRSDNELIKFGRMFTGDAIQLAGRLIASINKYHLAKAMIKSGDVELSQQGHELLSSAKTGLAKAGSAFILNQVMLLAIAMAFKWLKGKDDDEEWGEIAKNEAMANMIGLLPFGGDIYDKFLGYEPTNMAYTALSNIIDATSGMVDGFSSYVSGEYQDETLANASKRKIFMGLSRLFGIPAQNLETYTKGIIGKISPATKEEWEAQYKIKSTQTYLDKVEKALANGDEEYADRIINIMFDSRTGKIKDDKVMEVTRDLIEQGYDVLPRVVNKSITYEGVEYTLTDKQYKQFTKIYSQANESVKKMVNLKAFAKIDDEAKAKAMTFIYNYYYNLAIEDMLGEDLESKTILFAEAIPIEQLAMAISQAQIYTADTDKKGVAISGSRKAKIQSYINSLGLTAVQKYMIMGYLGYTNKYGETQVKSYINRLKLTKSQKEKLFEMSGY